MFEISYGHKKTLNEKGVTSIRNVKKRNYTQNAALGSALHPNRCYCLKNREDCITYICNESQVDLTTAYRVERVQ